MLFKKKLLALYFVRNGLTIISGAIVPVAMIKTLGVETFGIFATLNTAVFLIQIFSDLGLGNAYMREEASEGKDNLHNIISLRILTSFIISTMLAIISLIFFLLYNKLDREIVISVIVLLISLPIFSVSTIILNANIYKNNIKSQIYSELVGKIIWISLSLLAIVKFKSLALVFISLLISIFIQTTIVMRKLEVKFFHFKIRFNIYKEIFSHIRYWLGNSLVITYSKLVVVFTNILAGNAVGGAVALGYRGVDILNDVAMTGSLSLFKKMKADNKDAKTKVVSGYIMAIFLPVLASVILSEKIGYFLSKDNGYIANIIKLLACLGFLSSLNIIFFNLNVSEGRYKLINMVYLALTIISILSTFLYNKDIYKLLAVLIFCEFLVFIVNLTSNKSTLNRGRLSVLSVILLGLLLFTSNALWL